jgi:hypothetical protein
MANSELRRRNLEKNKLKSIDSFLRYPLYPLCAAPFALCLSNPQSVQSFDILFFRQAPCAMPFALSFFSPQSIIPTSAFSPSYLLIFFSFRLPHSHFPLPIRLPYSHLRTFLSSYLLSFPPSDFVTSHIASILLKTYGWLWGADSFPVD